MKWPQAKLQRFMVGRRGSVDPSQCPAEVFDLYSIPAFDTGKPQVAKGSQIGSVKQCVQTGDVLLSRIVPHIRRAWVVGERAGRRQIASGEWIVFRGDEVFPGYLRHVLVYDGFHVQLMQTIAGVGGSLMRARPSGVAEISIPLPPLPEQKRIAAILDKADAIRRKRQESIRLAHEFLRCAFLDMFGDPVTNPKGWPVRSLGDLGLVQGGLQLTPARMAAPIEVPYLRVANVYRDRLDLEEVKTIRVTANELDRTRLVEGDLLIVEGHGNPTEIGCSSVWDGSLDPCVHQNHLVRLRPDRSLCTPAYVSAFLNSHGGRRQMGFFGKTTSGLNTISTGNVRSIALPLPPVVEQRAYTALLLKMQSVLSRTHAVSRDSDALCASLSHRAFAGEL